MRKICLTAMCAGIALIPLMQTEALARPVGRVGRPAARVARRTVVMTSIYVASLPKGCVTENIEGTEVYKCGNTYYQHHGSQYAVVNVN